MPHAIPQTHAAFYPHRPKNVSKNLKASFQESEHGDDSFRILKNRMSLSPYSSVDGNAMTEMPASLIASTCSLIVLHDGDATNSTFFSLRFIFTAANNWSILNFSQNL